jgi:hypothetical protein
MRGVFVIEKYRDAQAREPYEIVRSTNAFTTVGLEWMWRMMLGELRDADGTLTDQLASARIVVGDGSREFAAGDERLAGEHTDQATLDQPPVIDGASITMRATFGESDAIFDWQERGVVTAQGVLLDRSVADGGRKVLGSVWQVAATLTLENGS